jgi:hypothetical protein
MVVESQDLDTVPLLSNQVSSSISESDKLISLNLSGKKFYILLHNFARYPESRLGMMVRCTRAEDILKYCDKYTPGAVQEFYFDRTWKGFNDILDVYRLGKLHLNSCGTCPSRLREDLEYWNISQFLLDPCCTVKYYPAIAEADQEIVGQKISDLKYEKRMQEEDFGDTQTGRIRKYLWDLTEYPETSLAARAFAFISMSVVIISTITFVLSTLPELATNLDLILFENKSLGEAELPVERWEKGITALRIVDELTMWFFTFEYITRLACSPNKLDFVKAPLNIIDLLAILPYFLSFAVEELKDTAVIGRTGKVFRLIRVMRILRVFKLVRHFTGLQTLICTLQQAGQELGLLMILMAVTVITISSLIYFAEKDGVKKWTFTESFWWGLMALTTVGNGERAPSTFIGKSIGSLCAISGVFILALPVPIVLNSFSSNYKNRVWRNEVMLKKQGKAEKIKKEGLGLKLIDSSKINGSTTPAV